MVINFRDLPQVKKAAIGEQIIDNYIRKWGYIPYRPGEEDGAHPFDRLIASKDKRNILIVEIKTKPARFAYPDTGINKKSYQEYQYIYDKYKIKIFLFFVDEKKEEIYGNYLNILDQPRTINYSGINIEYPIEEETKYGTIIRYWPLSAMKMICKLNSDQIESLNSYSTRNPEYEEIYKRNK